MTDRFERASACGLPECAEMPMCTQCAIAHERDKWQKVLDIERDFWNGEACKWRASLGAIHHYVFHRAGVGADVAEAIASECEHAVPALRALRPALDDLPQTTPLDVCTDPDNCKRCKAPKRDKHMHEHAGIRFGPF